MFFQLHPSEASRKCSGYDDYENAIEDQSQAHSLGNTLPSGKHFFCEDHNGKLCHRCDIHDAQGEEEDKEQPVRSQAIDAVLKAHTKGASGAVTPPTMDEIQRRAEFCQADPFRGGKLLEPGQYQDAATNPCPAHNHPMTLLRQT